MMANLPWTNIIKILILSIFVISILGCATPRFLKRAPDPETTILIDRPEVFSRERLLIRRHNQKQWLEKKLEPPYSSGGYQGLREIRVFSGIYGKLGLEFDPLKGKLETAQLKTAIDQVEINRQIQDLNAQINQMKLQQQIKELESKLAAEPDQPPANEDDSQTEQGITKEELDSAIAALKKDLEAKINSAKNESPTQTKTDQVSDADEISTKVTEAQLHPIDKFLDDQAYRNVIQAALNEQSLDDTHDLFGSTIHTFKFDVSILTQDTTDAFGKVNVEIKEPSLTDKDWKKLYDRWLESLEERIQREAVALQRMLNSNALQEEERHLLATAMHQALLKIEKEQELISKDYKKAKDNNGISSTDFESQTFSSKFYGKANFSIGDIRIAKEAKDKTSEEDKKGIEKIISKIILGETGNLTNKEKRDLYRGIYSYIIEKYSILSDYANINKYEVGSADDKLFIVIEASPSQTRVQSNNSAVVSPFQEALQKTKSTYVYIVEPKEQTQNISDVAATEKLKNFVLSLKAALPQDGISAETYTEYINRSNARLQSILRQPVVVGFANSRDESGPINEFGWIFGPQFHIDEKKQSVEYRFSPKSHTVQATLVLPAWWQKVKFEVSKSWVDPLSGKPRKIGWKKSDQDKKTVIIERSLRPDISALTDVLLETKGVFNHKPYIIKTPYTLVHNQKGKQHLIIRGERLWRDPQVFVGTQKADRIEILPDMLGILAEFKDFQFLAGGGKADLMVVTSQGATALRDAVTIGDKNKGPVSDQMNEVGKFVTLQSTRAVPEEFLEFSVDPANTPVGYSEIALIFERIDVDRPEKIEGSPVGAILGSSRTFKWKLHVDKNKAHWQKPHEFKLDVKVKLTPDNSKSWQDWPSVLTEGQRTIAYFPDGDHKKIKFIDNTVFKVSPDGKFEKGLRFEIADKDLLFSAYPDIESAFKNNKVELSFGRYADSPRVKVSKGKNGQYVIADDQLEIVADTIAPSDNDKSKPKETSYSKSDLYLWVAGNKEKFEFSEDVSFKRSAADEKSD